LSAFAYSASTCALMAAKGRRAEHRCMRPQASGNERIRTTKGTDLRWQAVATGASRPCHHKPAAWWQRALAAMRPPLVLGVVAGLLAIGLLTAFQRVVAQAVSQGAAARTAARTDATGRCKLQTDIGAHQRCLLGGGEQAPAATTGERSQAGSRNRGPLLQASGRVG
jgi:hypothetical protein